MMNIRRKRKRRGVEGLKRENCFIATWPHLKSPVNEPGLHGKKPETGLTLGQ
jgi:hypothetical protein